MIVKTPNKEELEKNSLVGYIHFRNKTNGNQSVAQFGNKESFLKFKEEKIDNDDNLDIIASLLI
jgi:hypothetical protein